MVRLKGAKTDTENTFGAVCRFNGFGKALPDILTVGRKIDTDKLGRRFKIHNGAKRKRIEKGLKLQEVASGICSISYLSRVENNQSIPSEDNLEMLFERLDLNYNEIKRKRNNDVFDDLLKNELSEKNEDMIAIMSNIISSNAYSNIELDLFVLYESLLSKNYEEARYILIRQEVNVELFNNKEMLFYLYLFCRYLFETNQNKRAYEQIKVLNSIDMNNQFMKSIIYDLSIDVAFMMGEYEQVIKFYYLLNQNENCCLWSS
mgnify:CR=1 FL=1